MHDEDAASRPATPASPRTSSLYHATATIDDLTMALVNFSRVPSPEPPNLLACCCGREDCENALSWLECKSRLESRLTLSGGGESSRPVLLLIPINLQRSAKLCFNDMRRMYGNMRYCLRWNLSPSTHHPILRVGNHDKSLRGNQELATTAMLPPRRKFRVLI